VPEITEWKMATGMKRDSIGTGGHGYRKIIHYMYKCSVLNRGMLLQITFADNMKRNKNAQTKNLA
jgi:hypothetical protein